MTPKQKSFLLLFLGLLFTALIKIISHYAHFGDLTEGFLTGMGFGLMVMGLLGISIKHQAH